MVIFSLGENDRPNRLTLASWHAYLPNLHRHCCQAHVREQKPCSYGGAPSAESPASKAIAAVEDSIPASPRTPRERLSQSAERQDDKKAPASTARAFAPLGKEPFACKHGRLRARVSKQKG